MCPVAGYHEVNNSNYVNSDFRTKDAGGKVQKINAYVHTDGLAVFCRYCSTVDKGFACTFRLMKTAQPVDDADDTSVDAMECSGDERSLQQWYWRCNVWQPHLPSCKPNYIAKDGTSQTMYFTDMLTAILVPYAIQAQGKLTTARIKQILPEYLRTPAGNTQCLLLKKKLRELLTGSTDVNIERLVCTHDNWNIHDLVTHKQISIYGYWYMY